MAEILDSSGKYMQNGLPGEPMRKAMETSSKLTKKGSIYVGTGAVETLNVGGEMYNVYETQACEPTSDVNQLLVSSSGGNTEFKNVEEVIVGKADVADNYSSDDSSSPKKPIKNIEKDLNEFKENLVDNGTQVAVNAHNLEWVKGENGGDQNSGTLWGFHMSDILSWDTSTGRYGPTVKWAYSAENVEKADDSLRVNGINIDTKYPARNTPELEVSWSTSGLPSRAMGPYILPLKSLLWNDEDGELQLTASVSSGGRKADLIAFPCEYAGKNLEIHVERNDIEEVVQVKITTKAISTYSSSPLYKTDYFGIVRPDTLPEGGNNTNGECFLVNISPGDTYFPATFVKSIYEIFY